jgi:predicted NBD/HSP70 family sugar kinase
MRSVNRTLVLDAIKAGGPVSRAALAKSVALAKPTVSVIVDDLLATGLVRELDRGQRGPVRGRPPVLIEFNARSMFVAGIHVGVQSTRIVLADAAGREIVRRMLPTPRLAAEAALMEIAAALDDMVGTAGIGRRDVSSVGVCVPGLVDLDTGTCVLAPNLGWRDVPMAQILATRIGASLFVHNGAQAAAAAEAVEGAGRGSKTLAMLYAGTGVGAAVVQDGRVFHGSRGMAGEIGHVPVAGATARCACGLVGCLETIASAQAVARAARAAVAEGRQTRMAPLGDELTPADVYAAAEAGDEVARGILAEAGRNLGLAGAWLVNVINPDVLVLAGGLAGAGEALTDPFRETVRRHSVQGALERLTIRTWALGQDAKVRGAVILALQQADQSYRLVFGAS